MGGKRWFILAAVLLLCTVWAPWGVSASGKVHGDCTMCHLETGGGGLLIGTNPTELCLGCHDGSLAFATQANFQGEQAGYRYGQGDHPVEVKMSHTGGFQDVGELGPLPLSAGEVITCITCHDPHEGSQVPGMLRMSNNGSALCFTCHLV